MPRPKGSKNKKPLLVENVDEKLAVTQREIAELTEALRAKRTELKALNKAKAESARIAAAKKAEEDRAAILSAVERSGKSLAEVLELLQ